jgi:signal transduction histidine kinase/DNA-binding response OmpR family regulator/HPt (histidine-containing phosphotransfer) domain-containing protein
MPVEPDLRILLVEDSPTDAELIVHRLHHDGLAFTYRRVETADFLVRALTELDPHILLCDNRLPNLDAASVIEIVGRIRPHLPIVIVTGTLDDEAAAGLIKAGASDFIRKDRMGRLLAAVTSALERARDQRMRSEQESKLRESELILRLALGATDQGVWRWDVGQGADGFDWDAPCTALLGLDSGISTNYAVWANAIYATDRAAVLAEMNLALDPTNRLDDFVSDFRVARPDGTISWLAAAGRAVFEPNAAGPAMRKPVRILGTIRDVSRAKAIEQEREAHRSELEKAREAAEQASQAKSRFLAGISHELRTPLHGILGYAELLIMAGDLNPVQSERLQAMMSAGQYLLNMINGVLDMSQIEAGRLELCPIVIELNDLVRDCFDLIRPKATAKGLALVLKSAAPLRLFADPTRLEQVLINLLGNSVKFTPTGTVEMRLRPTEAGDCIRLEVADTGPGIWERHRDKLFQTFERLNAEAVSGIEGAGLGLALAAGLVHRMGGRIGYDNNPGGGSLFWIELPRGPVSSVELAAVKPLPLAQRTPLRVLVADDEAMNRNIAREFLTRAGHEVVCVDGGIAAVEAAATEHFDVILMDVRMPSIDGLEATRRIRALPAPHGKVGIVAVTAQAFAEQIEICRQAGMDSHVAKPFRQSVLLAALQNAVSTAKSTILLDVAPVATSSDGARAAPLFDSDMFAEIVEFMPAPEVVSNLNILITRAETLLSGLGMLETSSSTGELARDAHKLAGGAGGFGFLSVAAACRRFEASADAGAAEMVSLAEQLAAAIEMFLPAAHELVARIPAPA